MTKLKTLIIVVIIISCSKIKEQNTPNVNNKEMNLNETGVIDLLKRIDFLQTISNNIYVRDKIHLINEENDTIPISEIEKIEKKIFFYYSYSNCTPCIDNEIERLKKFANISNIEIVIISNYEKIRDMYVFKKINEIPFSIYNLAEDKIDLPISDINIPFYFKLSKDFKIQFVYTPNGKENTEFIQAYFNQLIKSK